MEARAVDGGWVGRAFGSEGVIAIGAGPTEHDFLGDIRQSVEDYLATYGQVWLTQIQHGGDAAAPNCPEGAIKLPIDLWVCKLTKTECPIQAQVFVDDPEAFFAACLAPEERRADILSTMARGEYAGFHHSVGRFLCVRCEDEVGVDTSFSYHYPWELAALQDYAPFEPVRDTGPMLRRLLRTGIRRTALENALCATHALALVEVLYPELLPDLRVLDFEVARPAPRVSRPTHNAG